MITTTLEAALVILAIEFALLAPLAVFFTLRGARSVEAATTSEATELVAKVADTEDARRSALETVFREKYNYEGDELDKAVDEFMQREKAFYNAVVGAVLGRGDSKISEINNELTKVVAPWISLTPKNMVDAKSVAAVTTAKDQIEIELGQTKETLEKMIAEYNRAFQREAERKEADDAKDAETETADAVEDNAEAEVGDDLDELDYKTEELHDLDDVLAAIEAKKADTDTDTEGSADPDGSTNPDPDPETPSAEPEPSDESIVNLDEDDDEMVDEADSVDELEALEALDDDIPDDTPAERADKPMTADDLDELMESLDADGVDEKESA